MRKWRCYFCQHIYDEAAGDREAGIPAGTPFEDLPEGWYCPDCGAAKSDFTLMEESP